MSADTLHRIKTTILESKKIAVLSHLRPDGDSVCSSLALKNIGEILGKTMTVVIKDRLPFPFNNFPDVSQIHIGELPPADYDCVILLECANVARSGQTGLENLFKINIDHHHSNDFYADINWVDPEAAAVACLIFRLGEELGITLTPQIATQLYSAIVSDTGSFQFSNTNAKAFKTCYKLVEFGAVPIQVSEMLFHNNPWEKIKLLGQVLSTLQLNPEGNIAVISMFKRFLDDLNLREIDTEDITTLARSIKGAQLVLFFKEMEPDTFRVSVRSKASANAALVAEHFGGGGHLHAAGFTVTGLHHELIKHIPQTVNRLLKLAPPHSSTE
jgi:phosphoesterase RecJ-like protein